MDEKTRPVRRRAKARWVLAAFAVAAVALGAAWLSRPAPPPPGVSSGETMRAVVYHAYGPPDVLRLERVDKLLPNDDQVLIRVRAAAANPLDWHYMRGTPYLLRVVDSGLRRPSDPRLGRDVAGEVVAVGRSVTLFKPGDAVFGTGGGSFAEYVRASEKRIAAKPPGITFEQAAAIPIAALTALQGLRDEGRVKPGQKVLINGASGGVGTFAVQIAKALGAEVTGVCSTRNVELVRALGADHVIDYTKEDFTRGVRTWDVVLDNVGNHELSAYRRVLTKAGIYVGVGGGGPDDNRWGFGYLLSPVKSFFLTALSDQQFGSMLAEVNRDDLLVLAGMVESGRVKPVLDRTYTLEQTAEAIRYLETGRARGKVVIRVADGG